MSTDNDQIVQIEEAEENESLNIPKDKRRVKTEKLDLPVETVNARVLAGRINPQPDFQRFYVWNNSKASKLIESLLLDIPIPVIYMAEEKNRTLSVVDGQQRITSICSFISGKFPDGKEFKLSGLQVLEELNGKLFRELSAEQQETILGAGLRVITISSESDPDVKFEVFERLNVGAEKLNDQELRNIVYRGRYNELLIKLSKHPSMLAIMGSKTPHQRMLDRQMILRFFAMWRNTHLKYKGPMKQFLNKEIEKYQNPSDNELTEMESVFIKSLEMAYSVFGKNAFRRFSTASGREEEGCWESRKLNMALWDTLLYTFTYYEKSQIIPVVDSIREEFLDVSTNDPRFVEYITATTDKAEHIQYRADVWRSRIQALVSSREPRNFSYELKKKLYTSNSSCKLCGQRISEIDDSEVDHIQHYWRGGKTIEENARLVHRYCNRARGGRE